MPDRTDDENRHPMVVSNLLDIQARLRGDPASLAPSRTAPPLETPEPAPDRLEAEAADAESRMEALRRRLESLELELDAFESAIGHDHPARQGDASVLEFPQPDEPAADQD